MWGIARQVRSIIMGAFIRFIHVALVHISADFVQISTEYVQEKCRLEQENTLHYKAGPICNSSMYFLVEEDPKLTSSIYFLNKKL